MTQRYVRTQDGVRRIWRVEPLWRLAAKLPVNRVRIDSIAGFDEVTWFSLTGPLPTCRAVAEHARRMLSVDRTHPVILSREGHVMDGMHRIGRAWLEGDTEIDVVQFLEDPAPDVVEAV